MSKLRYGLIIPNKKSIQVKEKNVLASKQQTLVKPSFFNEDDSDQEEQATSTNKGKPLATFVSTNSRLKKQTQIELEKAISQDPNIFEYDTILDQLEKEKAKLDPKLNNKNQSKEVN